MSHHGDWLNAGMLVCSECLSLCQNVVCNSLLSWDSELGMVLVENWSRRPGVANPPRSQDSVLKVLVLPSPLFHVFLSLTWKPCTWQSWYRSCDLYDQVGLDRVGRVAICWAVSICVVTWSLRGGTSNNTVVAPLQQSHVLTFKVMVIDGRFRGHAIHRRFHCMFAFVAICRNWVADRGYQVPEKPL